MLPVIVVRSFLDGNLSNVDTWGTMSPLNDVATEASSEKLQINLIIKECLNNEPHLIDNSNNKSIYYVGTKSNDCQRHIADILLSKKLIGLTKLLSNRELDVLKSLFIIKNAKQCAKNLHISERTFANHRFNITKKLNIPAIEAADFIFNCSNVNLYNLIIDKVLP